MAEPSASALARIEARMEENFELALAGVEKQQGISRLIQETLRMILERLTPGESEGPTVGKVPAQLIEVVGNVDRKARRILTWLEAIGQDLAAGIVMLLNEERWPPTGSVVRHANVSEALGRLGWEDADALLHREHSPATRDLASTRVRSSTAGTS